MNPRSIRVRLTAWYLAVLALATIGLAGSSWFLLKRTIIRTADANLAAQIDGVTRFIGSMERALDPGEVRDEFREYAQLTFGEALLEVDQSGTVLCVPTLPRWEALRAGLHPAVDQLMYTDRRAGRHRYRVVATSIVVQGRRYDVTAATPIGPAYEALEEFRWGLAALVPTVLLLGAGGGYWISRRALAPVDRMTRAVQAISLRNLDRRLDVPKPDDELRRLAVTFNEMLMRLQGAVADMVRFTAEASHELRTPVSVIRATAEVALTKDRPAGDYRQALGDVLAESERMSVLVTDLLTLARADAGVEPRETSGLNLAAVVREAIDDVAAEARRRAIAIDLQAEVPVSGAGQPRVAPPALRDSAGQRRQVQRGPRDRSRDREARSDRNRRR